MYAAPISDKVLDVEGLPYIHKPKQRPYYAAYKPDYVVRDPYGEVDEKWLGLGAYSVIAEVEPYEDCIPDHPVKMHFKKTLYGNISDRMLNQIWFWEYENPEPKPLYAGKTYIMALNMNTSMEYSGLVDKEKYPDVTTVWTPWLDIEGAQYTKMGEKREDDNHKGQYWEEVSENFYETPEGQRWINLIDGFQIADYSIPVIPTDDSKLLMYFYNENAGIIKGRDITTEEYTLGKKVCLIQENFAKINQIDIGDTIELPLYYADYAEAPSFTYPIGMDITTSSKLLNAKGELYKPFESGVYEIVGIYQSYAGMESYTGYEAPNNGVIIPAASVKKSDENNIMAFGPMKGYNTTFQIENGKIEEFWELWNKKGNDELEITFYDKGYSSLEQNFKNTRVLSLILFISGTSMVFLILLFFSHMFVTKQRMRIAIERTLGMTRRKCRYSLESGLLFLTAVGCIWGSSMGALITKLAVNEMGQGEGYSRMFSAGKSVVETLGSAETFSKILAVKGMDIILPCTVALGVFLTAWVISDMMIRKNLSKEPIELLGNMKHES